MAVDRVLGAIAAGAVAVPVNTLLTASDFRNVLEDCGARITVVDPQIVDPTALSSMNSDVWTVDEMRKRVEASAAQPVYAATHRDAMAFFLYSSGTTGEPKGVVHLQHDMWICCETYGTSVLEIRPDDRCFSVAKLFFAYGLGNAQYFPFHVGATAVLFAGRPTPAAVFDMVRAHRPTLFFGVPTAFANMLVGDRGRRRRRFHVGADVRQRGRISSRGDPRALACPHRHRHSRRHRLDGDLPHLSDSTGAATSVPDRAASPSVDTSSTSSTRTGTTVASGEMGDLIVRGDSTMAFYWNKHEATKSRVAAATGSGRATSTTRDADGYYVHGGRSDDMIKAGGIWVSPVEVEAALIRHPSVLECAVIAIEDEDGLHKPHAYVVLQPGVSRGRDDRRSSCGSS